MNTKNHSNRLDGILDRNRKNAMVDLAMAVLFPVAMFLGGMTLASELPKLGNPVAPAASTAAHDAAAHDVSPV